MDLQGYLIEKFKAWQPSAPGVVNRAKGDITLSWKQVERFGFLGDQLLYRVEKNNKLPKWITVYSGGKTTKIIDNLAPRHPHKFRLKVILKATAVPRLADMTLQHYGDEDTIINKMGIINNTVENNDKENVNSEPVAEKGDIQKDLRNVLRNESKAQGDPNTVNEQAKITINNVYSAVKLLSGLKQVKVDETGDGISRPCEAVKWIESQWSAETWTNTDTDGSSAVCFCMAVKCGYLKQVQAMLEERPELIGIVNSNSGFTPLATAVRKGDANMVRFLLSAGAEIDQPSSAGQTALHLAVLNGDLDIVELLMEKGADNKARDWNGLRVEHYAVDSCSLEMIKFILNRGGDLKAKDYNGWTPLFRALCQGAKTAVIEELVTRGSNINEVDNAGLPLTSVAKLLKNRHGRSRDSIMRIVDSSYPKEKALANFTRLTKKIYSVHTLFKGN